MTLVHLLTDPPTNQNTAAFLAPIVWHRHCLAGRSVSVRLFYRPAADLFECDVLAINSKVWPGAWESQRVAALALLEGAQARGRRVVFFDRTSSAGMLNIDVLRQVDRYTKGALYADRTLYDQPIYGSRLFADYYHRHHGVADDPPPAPQEPVGSDARKLVVAWNTGLANYSLTGPRRASWYAKVPWRGWFAPPRLFTRPESHRPIDASCRTGKSHSRTVAWQRKRMAELLAGRVPTERVSKAAYMRELRRSKAVLSPFGYSEINYKDFETFLSGSVLVKPDMSHLETWPNYFQAGRTYVAHRWDLSDVQVCIDAIVSAPDRHQEIARSGQDLYRHHAASEAGGEAFADRFAAIVGLK